MLLLKLCYHIKYIRDWHYIWPNLALLLGGRIGILVNCLRTSRCGTTRYRYIRRATSCNDRYSLLNITFPKKQETIMRNMRCSFLTLAKLWEALIARYRCRRESSLIFDISNDSTAIQAFLQPQKCHRYVHIESFAVKCRRKIINKLKPL